MDLHKLEIQPLSPIRQREFLERYLGKETGEALFWQLAGHDVADVWQAWQEAGGTWEEFWSGETMPEMFEWRYAQRHSWERLRAGELPPLLALGRNPYMLFMMVQVYLEEQAPSPRTGDNCLHASPIRCSCAGAAHRSRPVAGSKILQSALVRLAYAMQSASERGTAVDRSGPGSRWRSMV